MAVATTDAFQAVLIKSKLLDENQLKEVRSDLISSSTPQVAAKRLIDKGYLTLWQARQLLANRLTFHLGTYKLLEEIGSGARGTVYRAEHKTMGRIVALKVMAPQLVEKPEAVERFRREVKVAASLNHPNIIQAFDADRVNDVHFMVMEYVNGKDLNHWLKINGAPLPAEWACECIRQAALGLQHAHEQGMVHRDIKPGNVMVVCKGVGEPLHGKILDMGFARMSSDDGPEELRLTRPWQIFGTPDYMAPEQAESARKADIRSDIYSLGCTLYKLLAGKVPFTGATPVQKLLARANAEPPKLREANPEISEELEAFVLKMMARDANERFQTPAELAEAIRPFCMKDGEKEDSTDNSSGMVPASPPPEPVTEEQLADPLPPPKKAKTEKKAPPAKPSTEGIAPPPTSAAPPTPAKAPEAPVLSAKEAGLKSEDSMDMVPESNPISETNIRTSGVFDAVQLNPDKDSVMQEILRLSKRINDMDKKLEEILTRSTMNSNSVIEGTPRHASVEKHASSASIVAMVTGILSGAVVGAILGAGITSLLGLIGVKSLNEPAVGVGIVTSLTCTGAIVGTLYKGISLMLIKKSM